MRASILIITFLIPFLSFHFLFTSPFVLTFFHQISHIHLLPHFSLSFLLCFLFSLDTFLSCQVWVLCKSPSIATSLPAPTLQKCCILSIRLLYSIVLYCFVFKLLIYSIHHNSSLSPHRTYALHATYPFFFSFHTFLPISHTSVCSFLSLVHHLSLYFHIYLNWNKRQNAELIWGGICVEGGDAHVQAGHGIAWDGGIA